jgi:hypothetical protein
VSEVVQFEISWDQAEDLPLQFANQFAVQWGSGAGADQVPDGIYLTVGTIAPPIFTGTPEQIQRQLDKHSKSVPVRPLIRLVISAERAEELVALLQTTLKQLENRGDKPAEKVTS